MNEIDHMVDLQSFIDNEADNIYNYFEGKSNDSYSQQILDPSWIAERILILFSQWSTGITRSVLRQDILNQARTSRSRQHVKPDSTHHPVLHGTIHEVDIIKRSNSDNKSITSAVIHIKQEGYNLFIKANLHGALLPFVGRFISGGYKIHFANIRFSNNCLIPNQLCVIDLKKTKEDIEFIKQCPPFSIAKITDQNCPESLLLRVEGPTKNGIKMSDCTNTIDLYLDEERMSLKQLLNFGDIILFYDPWTRLVDDDQVCLTYGPNSVLFRVPVTVEANFSQISQHVSSNLTQDGLSFRNSAACRSVRGTVLTVMNQFEFDERYDSDMSKWTSSTLLLLTTSNEKVTINIRISTDMPYEVRRVVASLKPNHFVWIFGLIENDTYSLSFTSETTLYNTSLLYSIIASNIVFPRTLNVCGMYRTFVARAVIINVLTCEVKHKHKICNTLLRSNISKDKRPSCPICQTMINNFRDIDEEFMFKLEIDDKSCDPITVYGNGSKFSFWSTKPFEWKNMSPEKREKLLFSFIGREFVFVLSKANEQEFCGFSDDYNDLRIDQCIRPVGDIEREVKKLIKWHTQLDKEDLSQNQHLF